MLELSPSAAVFVFALVQFLGWIGGLLARCSVRSRHQTFCYGFFILALFAVGITTSMAWMVGSTCWMVSATSFCGMILLAISDFDHASRPVTI
jgi:hypothetical protein